MNSVLMKQEVEQFYQWMRSYNSLFLKAKAGQLTPPQVALYLENIRFLVFHTPLHLQLAYSQSLTNGHEALARFFSEKMKEEKDHDLWAKEDLKKIERQFNTQFQVPILSSMKNLIFHIESIIRENPVHYLFYMFLSEYFTVLGAAEWLDHLENRCGIPRNMMTVIGNHGILDQDHVEEDLAFIETHLKNSQEVATSLKQFKNSMKLYSTFCEEVAGGFIESRDQVQLRPSTTVA